MLSAYLIQVVWNLPQSFKGRMAGGNQVEEREKLQLQETQHARGRQRLGSVHTWTSS